MFFIVMQIRAPEPYDTDLRYHAQLIGVLCANTDRQYVRGIGFIGGDELDAATRQWYTLFSCCDITWSGV